MYLLKIRQTSDTESCEILNEPRVSHNEALISLSSQIEGGVLSNHELNSQHLILKDYHNHHNPYYNHNHHHHHHHHNRHHRVRPRSRDLEQQSPSEHYPPSSHHFRRNNNSNNSGLQHQQYHRNYNHHHHHKQHRDNNVKNDDDDGDGEDEDGHDDTEDNLADEELEEDEVGRDVRQQKRIQTNHLRENVYENHENNDDLNAATSRVSVEDTADVSLEANVINDELKYGAGHKQMNTVDSNPLESQSEWSDEDCREEATGK